MIERGQSVVVLEENTEWSKVLVPRWIPVYVHTEYVVVPSPESLGSVGERRVTVGKVVADRLVVRCVPERKHEALFVLQNGAEIEITLQDGEWYRIVPPENTVCWVSTPGVKKVKSLDSEGVLRVWKLLVEASPKEPETAAGIRLPQLAGAPERGREVDRPELGESDRSSIRGIGLEALVSPRSSVPLADPIDARVRTRDSTAERRPLSLESVWDQIPRILQGLGTGGDRAAVCETLEHLVSGSDDPEERLRAGTALKLLNAYEERQRTIRAIEQLIQRSERREQELRRKLVQSNRASRDSADMDSTALADSLQSTLQRRVQAGSKDPYLARGRVASLDLSNGQQGWFRLLDGDRLVYYLRAGEGLERPLRSAVHRFVGVKGKVVELGPRYATDLIVVSGLEVLR
jgi:hypothetical protein